MSHAIVLIVSLIVSITSCAASDILARFEDFHFNHSYDVKFLENSPFRCPSTFLTRRRLLLHESLIDTVLMSHLRQVGAKSCSKSTNSRRPHLFIVIGPSGSGKSTLIKELMNPACFQYLALGLKLKSLPVRNFLHLSGDNIMEKLPGLIMEVLWMPFISVTISKLEYSDYSRWYQSQNEFPKKLYLDVADSCHVESAQLVQTIAFSAIEFCVDIIFEGTGQRPAFYHEAVALARQHNYFVHVLHMNTDIDVSLKRVKERFLATGRAVPSDVVKKSYYLSRRTFRQLAAIADDSSSWNSNNSEKFRCLDQYPSSSSPHSNI
jgi:predicted ABC-type ATPase